jgi:hypothetical protein
MRLPFARWPLNAVILGTSLLTASATLAQGNYRAAPLGGRSALMGGTGVALARDGSAPFLNPATIIHIDDSGLAFSVNFYTAQWTDLAGFHLPAGTTPGAPSLPNTSLDTTRADALPSTLCLFLTIGHWGDNLAKDEVPGHRKGRRKLAACLGQPERSTFSATAVGYNHNPGQGMLSANQAASVQRSWNRIYVGPSYSVYVSDSVALGASLNGIGTTASSTWGVDTMVGPGAGIGSASSYDTAMSAYSIDLGAMLGLVCHIDDVHVFGASVSTPSVHLGGSYNGTTAVQVQSGGASTASLATSTGGFTAPVPIRLAVGMGTETRRLRVEGDASAYIPITYLARADLQSQQLTQQSVTPQGSTSQSLSSSGGALQMTGQPVVDVALGLEYFLSPRFSVLGGASTDFSGLDPLPSTPAIGTLAEARMQRVATSFGVGSYGDGSQLLLGTELSYGWGKSIAVDPFGASPQLTLVDQRTYTVMLIVAGSASISAFRRTLSDLGDVVKFPRAP